MKITLKIFNDKLICIYQNEVENIAIKNHGTHKDIFFIPIKLNSEFYLKWYNKYHGWLLTKGII